MHPCLEHFNSVCKYSAYIQFRQLFKPGAGELIGESEKLLHICCWYPQTAGVIWHDAVAKSTYLSLNFQSVKDRSLLLFKTTTISSFYTYIYIYTQTHTAV